MAMPLVPMLAKCAATSSRLNTTLGWPTGLPDLAMVPHGSCGVHTAPFATVSATSPIMLPAGDQHITYLRIKRLAGHFAKHPPLDTPVTTYAELFSCPRTAFPPIGYQEFGAFPPHGFRGCRQLQYAIVERGSTPVLPAPATRNKELHKLQNTPTQNNPRCRLALRLSRKSTACRCRIPPPCPLREGDRAPRYPHRRPPATTRTRARSKPHPARPSLQTAKSRFTIQTQFRLTSIESTNPIHLTLILQMRSLRVYLIITLMHCLHAALRRDPLPRTHATVLSPCA